MSAFHLDVMDDYVYASDTFAELYLFDISTPEAPVMLDAYVTPGGLVEVTAHQQYVFASDAEAGVLILENLLIEPSAVDVPTGEHACEILPALPNPSTQETRLGFRMPQSGRLRIEILDPTGRRSVRCWIAW
ncbi:MAG: hypothetical protein GF330_07855 [Candidatus Eisenbacteria bacterium]|nr:hypothetical protein [Candidatus Eisenbacteria bacterium]